MQNENDIRRRLKTDQLFRRKLEYAIQNKSMDRIRRVIAEAGLEIPQDIELNLKIQTRTEALREFSGMRDTRRDDPKIVLIDYDDQTDIDLTQIDGQGDHIPSSLTTCTMC